MNLFLFNMETLFVLALVIGSFFVLVGLSCCLFGFRPIGVAANSCAASCQSVIGNAVKGSCFDIATCLAMRGCFIAFTIIGLLVLAGVGIYLLLNSEWLESACDWVQNFVSSVELKASSTIAEEQFRYAFGLARNVSFSKGFKATKGFLQR